MLDRVLESRNGRFPFNINTVYPHLSKENITGFEVVYGDSQSGFSVTILFSSFLRKEYKIALGTGL